MTATALTDTSSNFYLVAMPPGIASKADLPPILWQGFVRSVMGDR